MQFIIKNIKGLIQAAENINNKVCGKEMSVLPIIENAYLIIQDGLIYDYGSMEHCPQTDGESIDGSGKYVFPSYIDAHTHLVFAGSREKEFELRIKGASYEEIAAAGGGILNSAHKLKDASFESLYDAAFQRIMDLVKLGTGAIEIKSGYGLNLASEIKMLRVIKELKKNSPIKIKSTFLGAHAYPLAYKNNHEAYLDEIIQKMLPQIAEEDLADYIDVFCDRGFFSPEETDKILKAGISYGLKPRIHANELDYSGGIQVGVKNNALSVDHLEYTGDEEIKCLLQGNTMPILLPSTAFFLGLHYPPARNIIDSGLPLALASDYNPGSSPSGNMNFVLSLACIKLKMTPEEAINAATINAACALELENSHGSISKGKAANLFITKEINSYQYIPYNFGHNNISSIILNGRVLNI